MRQSSVPSWRFVRSSDRMRDGTAVRGDGEGEITGGGGEGIHYHRLLGLLSRTWVPVKVKVKVKIVTENYILRMSVLRARRGEAAVMTSRLPVRRRYLAEQIARPGAVIPVRGLP